MSFLRDITNILHIIINIYAIIASFWGVLLRLSSLENNLSFRFHDKFDLPTAFSDAWIASGPSPFSHWGTWSFLVVSPAYHAGHLPRYFALHFWPPLVLADVGRDVTRVLCFLHTQTLNVWYIYLHLVINIYAEYREKT